MRKVFVMAALASVASPVHGQTRADGPTVVPVTIEAGRLFVPVRAADGTEFEFMLATGIPTVFSESFAARVGDSPELTLGGAPLDLDHMQTLPDDRISVGGRVLHGVVGPSTLNQFDVLIDAPGGRLVLKPIGRRVEWEGMEMSEPTRVRILHGTLLSFQVELDGRATSAMMDLSMPHLMVNPPVLSDLGMEDEDSGDLRIGQTTLEGLPVRLSDHPLFEGWDPSGEGFLVVGAAAALDCAISISWVHREIRTCVR